MFGFGFGWGGGDEEMDDDDAYDRMCEMEMRQERVEKKYGEKWFKDQHDIMISNLRKSTVIGDKMVEVLEEVEKKGVGTFAVSEELKDAPITTIKLKADGTVLRFPLEEAEMEKLIPKLEMSPFGRGEKTLVDASVRNSWQRNPAAFEITNKNWTKFMTSVSSEIKKKLGITDSFVAKPYKLLLYKTGSFFKPHRDSEKEEGMFGTLVVQLPSKYTGGELVVRHGGSSRTFDHSTKGGGEEFLNYYSAFYCDCEHEVLPLQSGVRVCLIYNLVLKKRKTETHGGVPAQSFSSRKESFENILKEWRFNSIDDGEAEEISDDEDNKSPGKRNANDEHTPHHTPRLIYLLAHQYSQQSLNYANLKGTDKTISKFLMEMAEDSEMIAFLGIMDKHLFANTDGGEEFGTDEENGKPTITIADLRVLAMDKDFLPFVPAAPLDCGKGGFEEREVIPKSRLEKLKAHDSKVEYTGNTGTEITKQFRSSCILIFPSENLFSHCLRSLDDSTAEKMFLAKLEKYKTGNKKEDTKVLGTAFLKRQKAIAKSFEEMEKWLKVFMEVGNKDLLSIFIKSYWMIINSGLKTFLSTVLANRGNPLWDYLFEELNEQMKQLVSKRSANVEKKTISADEFSSLLDMIINTNDQSVMSTFLQGCGHLLFVHMNKLLPVVLGTGTQIGDEFLRAVLIKLFGNANPARNNNEIDWTSAVDAIININDEDNLLLSSFLTACSTPIKMDIDKFLPVLFRLKDKFGDRFIITELRKVLSRPPAADQFKRSGKLKFTFHNLLQFKDANLMSDFISGYAPVIARSSRDIIPVILDNEALFGWNMISDGLKKIIIGHAADGYDPPSQQLEIVTKVLAKWYGRQDVMQACTEYVKIIFEKCADWKDGYCTRGRFVDLGQLAPTLNLDITEFLQSRNAPFIVKLLQEVADKKGKKLNTTWLKVATTWFERLKNSVTVEDKKLLSQLRKVLTGSGHRFNK